MGSGVVRRKVGRHDLASSLSMNHAKEIKQKASRWGGGILCVTE